MNASPALREHADGWSGHVYVGDVTRALWNQLAEAESFLAIAKLVCLDVPHCRVALHEPDGRPFVCVDNMTDLADDQRLVWVDGKLWQGDPLLAAVREHRGPAEDAHEILLPIVEMDGLIGTIRCGHITPMSDCLRRDLLVLSTHVSVRLAQLGITTLASDTLSRRQHDVARLAVRGLPNVEIASLLAISENTVKKRLKEIFARLGVANRTELAIVLRPPVVLDGEAPIGISRDGALTITRGAPRRPETAARSP